MEGRGIIRRDNATAFLRIKTQIIFLPCIETIQSAAINTSISRNIFYKAFPGYPKSLFFPLHLIIMNTVREKRSSTCY